MHLTEAQLRAYTDEGLLFLPGCFSQAEIDVENIPVPAKQPRPEFLASRDFRPVVPLADSVLLSEN